jgi:hypothetical protein
MKKKKITFPAIFSKLSSIIDGSYNLTLNINETDVDEIVKVARLKGQLLKITVDVSDGSEFKNNDEV